MSKRIFSNKKDPLPITDNGRTPICYYHKQPITHFCVKKKCTLPLCDECLPIHKKEHINSKQIAMEGVIQFEQARGDALAAFEQRKGEIVAIQQKFRGKVNQYKQQIIEIVNNSLDSFCQDCLITDGNLQILQEIEERTSEIRAGSLKELIRYYQDIFGAEHFRKLYKMYYGDYLTYFKFETSKIKTEELVKLGIINTALREKSLNQEKPSQSPSIQSNQQLQITQNTQIASIRAIQNFTPVVHCPDKLVIKEKQEEESEMGSYRLLKYQKKKQEQNIYTDPNSKASQMISKLPSQHISQASRSKSKRKKGLSLTKSHQQLPLQTKQSFKSQDDFSQESGQRRTNWRNFINMGGTSTREGTFARARQANPRVRQEAMELNAEPVLNPREMRHLIMKKKNEQKSKQINSYKSSQLIIPTSQKLS